MRFNVPDSDSSNCSCSVAAAAFRVIYGSPEESMKSGHVLRDDDDDLRAAARSDLEGEESAAAIQKRMQLAKMAPEMRV